MPIHYPDYPSRLMDALVDQVSAFLKPEDPSLGDLVTSRYGKHPVSLLGMPELEAATNPMNLLPKPYAWRFYFRDRLGRTAYASVLESNSGHPKVGSVDRGNETALGLDAARRLPKTPQIRKQHYTFQVLALPGILTETFWLSLANDGHFSSGDYIIPYLSAKSFYLLYPYAAQDFLREAGEVARSRYCEAVALRSMRAEAKEDRRQASDRRETLRKAACEGALKDLLARSKGKS